MPAVKIADRTIGLHQPCFIIAEAGVNHNGDIQIARRLVDVAVSAGADAVKFQTFQAEKVVSLSAPKADYQLQTTDQAESQYAMLKKLELSTAMHEELFVYCQRLGILFLSTPFDEESADFLERLGVLAFKVSSGEITNLPLLQHIAVKKKPTFLSTGMSSLVEVGQAEEVFRESGNQELVLLHCVSNYPADPADVNLRAMETMAAAFQVPVGYSDHTPGVEVALAAAALGASVIEKHFTLDQNMPGPDHRASLEPEGLKAMIQGIRTVEAALGHGRKEPALSEKNTASVARRSLVAARDLKAGEILRREDIAIRRPGSGLQPSMLSFIIGLTLKKDVAEGEVLTREVFS
jgi:N-acetylneuraminate synthase